MNIPETKMIYFPEWGDNNQREPRIIWVDREFNDPHIYSGNTDIDQLHDNRRGHYKAVRCIPFTEAAWDVCQAFVNDYYDLEIRWNKLPQAAARASAQLTLPF